MSDDDANQQESSDVRELRCRSEYQAWHDEETLIHLRCERGYKMATCAQLLGCSSSTIHNWEQDLGIGKYGSFHCPWSGCDESFVTNQQLKNHHLEEHGESIAGVEVECEYCGSTYREKAAKVERTRFCSNECDAAWKREEGPRGENHPRWSRVTLTCRYCGDEFTAKQSRSDREKHCSKECQRKARAITWVTMVCEICGAEYKEKDHREHRSRYCSQRCQYEGLNGTPPGARVEITCQVCGDVFETYPCEADTRRFCSMKCRGVWYSDSFSGQNHPSWKGGESLYHALRSLLPGKWSRVAPECRRRWGEKCPLCDENGEESDRKLSAHHLVPLLAGGTNGQWNLIPFCDTCHTTVEWYTSGLFERVYTDWTEDELPDGRLSSSEYLKRCLAGGDLGGQATLDTFAD